MLPKFYKSGLSLDNIISFLVCMINTPNILAGRLT